MTTANQNLVEQPHAPIVVGSGDLLGANVITE